MALVAILGDTLKGKEGNVETSSIPKDGKYVGLYFSAHWCPPCKGFTPKLAQFYKDFMSGGKGDTLEIVFVSSDQDESSFNGYYGEMPWLALPFELRDKKVELCKKYYVQGIPTLIFLNSQTGEVVCDNGRNKVQSDPEGKDFPWD